MRREYKSGANLFILVLFFCLLLFSCTAHAATVNVPQAKPAAVNKIPVNPNAPPQGTITITVPQVGATWYTGAYQPVQWTCNGTRSNFVDITLWRNNQKVAVIGAGVGTGRTAYTVPPGTVAGSYELRATSSSDTRIEARKPVTIASSRFTLATPAETLTIGSLYTITWSYAGSAPAAVKLVLLDSYNAVVKEIYTNISVGSGGKGSWPWSVYVPMQGKTSGQYRFQISAAQTGAVLATSNPFTIMQPVIQAGNLNGWQFSPGSSYTTTWTTNLAGSPVKIELYSVSTSSVVQTIQSSVVAQASNSLNWSVPANLPANLYGKTFQIRITSLKHTSVSGSNNPFVIAKPTITIGLPDPQRALVKNQAYEVLWNYTGDPGAHVRIDIFNSATAVTPVWTVTSSTSVGLWGKGHVRWPGEGMYSSKLYLQVQSVEKPTVKDRREYTVTATGAAVSGTTSSGSTSTSASGSTSGSSTTGTTSSGSTSGTSGTTGTTTKKQLTQDTSFKYNATHSATFFRQSIVTLDAKGYVLNGQLASNQSLEYRSGKTAQFQSMSLVTFNGGYVQKGQLTIGQSLEYRSGKTAQFHAFSVVTLNNGYVQSGQLANNALLEYRSGKPAVQFRAMSVVTLNGGYVTSGQLTGNTVLEYRSGRSASFTGTVMTTFRSDGYVKSGQLANDTFLEYAPGQSKKWTAGLWPIFDDNGYTTTH